MIRKICLTIFLLVASIYPAKVTAQVNAEQMLRVGQNALYFDDYMVAIQYFNQAISAKPYLAQPYFLRAIAKLNLEDYLGAEEDASAAIERNPFIVDAYEVRGVARQNRGMLTESVDDYNQALSLFPKSRQLLFNKALAEQELGRADSAMISFDRLLADFPNYENGYVGRAKLYLEQKDTVRAKADIDKALSLNKNQANAYLLRADIAIHGNRDFENALSDLNEAIKLMPREPGLYINRAFLRYNLDDYFGAMADYDYAVQLDPMNTAAIYNRGLLKMEVRDYDDAIKDFSSALELDNDDYRSLYNRAYIYSEKHDIKHAMSDVNRLVEAFPNLPEALYMRSNLYRLQGNMRAAESDYNKALAIAKNLKPDSDEPKSGTEDSNSDNDKQNSLSPEAVAKRFTALRTAPADVELEGDYNNKSIRGKVQNRSSRIELEPMFALSYYTAPTELKPSAYFIREIDEVNATKALRFVVQLSNADITLNDEDEIQRHFRSIDEYNEYMASHPARAIDYFGRAMDYMALRNYTAAITDLNKTLDLTPDFALGYFQRAIARYKSLQAGNSDGSGRIAEIRAIASDFDRSIELSPRLAFAYFNKGNLLAETGDLTSALMAYNKAIEIKPDFGEAYYNRGYVYFRLGNHDRGVENLSKAGELGVAPSYHIIKRMH